MLILISPAKTLDFSATDFTPFTQARLLTDTRKLVKVMRQKNTDDLRDLMSISEKLADLNVERYQSFKTPFNTTNAKQAVLAFKGDVYTGLDAESLSEEAMAFGQQHLRILSGLYGILRPFDLMQAYRLEMGTKLATEKGKNLYEFWGEKITKLINKDLKEEGSGALINLASKEYYHAVKTAKVKGDIYDVQFKEERNGKLKIISFSAKKARGMMCRYIIENQLTKPEDMKAFNMDNYLFNDKLSTEKSYIFTR